jgi:2-methylcitrate dehydratase PrpD
VTIAAVHAGTTKGQLAADRLAEFAVGVRHAELPAIAIERARQCLVDAIGCAAFGRRFPWSRIVLDHVAANSAPGPCRIVGEGDLSLTPPHAALALGTLAHAFELDSLRKPGAGVHPGATVALPAFAVAQATGASGTELLQAIVAGCEVMFRIGAATLHTPETMGIHAPGLTGPFGAAVASGLLIGLTSSQLVNAMGIAGSFGGGLMAFAKAGQGGMVKRLHLGRAAEAGTVAASLAARGYEGPDTVLDGRFGLLDVFCERSDPTALTAGLGEVWESERLCLKRYACHVTAQAPVQFLRRQMAEHGFVGDDIEAMRVRGSAKLVSHHSQLAPADIAQAQYSVPFSLAIAAYADPENPESFDTAAIVDTRVRGLASRISTAERSDTTAKGWGADVQIRLKDGTMLNGTEETFRGCPETPFSDEELAAKFRRLTRDLGSAGTVLADRLSRVDTLESVRTITQDLR